MSAAPLISVIIPTLGKSPHLRGLLERLLRQKLRIGTFEVTVVGNLPNDATRRLVESMHRQIAQVRSSAVVFDYIETGRLGVNVARNRGLDRARGEIALFLDDDAILDTPVMAQSDHWLEHHTLLHRHYPDAIGLGGPYRLVGNESSFDRGYQEIAARWIESCRLRAPATSQLLGGNMSFKRAAIMALKLRFDEEIPFGGAESSFCHRLTLMGKTLLFFDELAIGHAPQLHRWSFLRKAFLQGAGTAWRERRFDRTPVQFASEWRWHDARIEHADLYRRFFNYGLASEPFETVRLRRPLDPNQNPIRFIFGFGVYWLRERRWLSRLRASHRRFYAVLRTAWLNA